MFISDSQKQEIKIYFPCDCGTEVMEVTYAKWDDGFENCYIDFKIDTFTANQTSILDIIKKRIKLAWRSLIHGDYSLQEIITNKEKLRELRDNLTEMLED